MVDPAILASRIIATLSLTLAGQDAILDQLVVHFGEDRVLLILDNFEQVIDCAGIVSELVSRCPGLKILVSSRERLNIDEEWIVPIQGLPVPPSAQKPTVEEASSFASLDLFVQRARRVLPGFELTPENLPHVIKICRQTRGLPLGLELAAAWVRTLEPADIAREIARNRDFLASTSRTIVDRHRSIRAVFEHSWRLLSPTEQATLQKLSIFFGGFGAEAAAEIVGAGLPVLAGLVDKSLLEIESPGRYDQHTLLRQYAEEKLAARPVERRRLLNRYGHYYLDYLIRTGGQLRGPDQGAGRSPISSWS